MKHKKQVVSKTGNLRPVEIAHTQEVRKYGLFVFFFAIALYINTLSHGFTQDDAIVIYDNMFTTQGIDGWKGIFTKDTFFGFFKEEGKANLVSGGRYRPLTPAMFALEHEIAGSSPFLGHLVNIVLYGGVCMLVFLTLFMALRPLGSEEMATWTALAAAAIYAAHPVHTEAVANIKGRDEIVSMLGSVATLWLFFRFHDTRDRKYIFYAMAIFFLALLSKENTITFLAVIPMALLTFRADASRAALATLWLLLPTVLFLLIRAAVIGGGLGDPPLELMNNPFVKFVEGQYVPFSMAEKSATTLYTLGKYIALLFFPHPLTHDYYPRHIEIMSWSHGGVIVSLILYGLLAVFAVRGMISKQLAGFCAFFFLATLSIVSNIVFPIGTNMSERFLFMPSLSFALAIGALLYHWVYSRAGKMAFYVILGILLTAYSAKTVTRNQVWKDDFTLFTTDVHTSERSAKVLNAAGGALTDKASKEKDPVKKREYLLQATGYLKKAVEIHPMYKAAWLIMGNAYSNLEEYDQSIPAYEKALMIDPNYADAITNLAITLRLAGQRAGEKENNLKKSLTLLRRSYQLAPGDMQTVRLLGVVNGFLGNHKEALGFFMYVADRQPNDAYAQLDLSRVYSNLGESDKAAFHLQKAISLDPNVTQRQ